MLQAGSVGGHGGIRKALVCREISLCEPGGIHVLLEIKCKRGDIKKTAGYGQLSECRGKQFLCGSVVVCCWCCCGCCGCRALLS